MTQRAANKQAWLGQQKWGKVFVKNFANSYILLSLGVSTAFI